MESFLELVPWLLFFDGSICKRGCGIGLVIVSPRGSVFEFSFAVEAFTNNQAEYEAVMKGLQLLKDANAEFIEVIGDSLLILGQIANEYDCKDSILRDYHQKCHELMRCFKSIKFTHVPREQNTEANNLAQLASGYRLTGLVPEIADFDEADWRAEIIKYLQDPSQHVDKKVKYKALKYVLLDDNLYYKTIDGVLLKCINKEEAKVVMCEVHDGICELINRLIR